MNAPLPVLTEEFSPGQRMAEFSRRIEELRSLRFQACAEHNKTKITHLNEAIGRYRAVIRRLSWLPARRGLFR